MLQMSFLNYVQNGQNQIYPEILDSFKDDL